MLAIYLFFIIGCWFNFRLVSGVEDELDSVKVAYITAMFGAYEMRLKPIHKQTMASDAFCFTDNIQLQPSVGWTIITDPYHETHPSKLDNGQYYNSFAKNKHPFNIAKYYKENFQNIPILRKYDVIVWIDGSLEIEFDGTSAWLYNKIRNKGEKIILFHHEMRYGILAEEAQSCDELDKYNNDKWLGFPQPIQYGMKQYNEYLEQGYDVTYWSKIKSKIGNTDPFVSISIFHLFFLSSLSSCSL